MQRILQERGGIVGHLDALAVGVVDGVNVAAVDRDGERLLKLGDAVHRRDGGRFRVGAVGRDVHDRVHGKDRARGALALLPRAAGAAGEEKHHERERQGDGLFQKPHG